MIFSGLGLLALFWLLPTTTVRAEAGDPFASCIAELAEAPEVWTSARCFYSRGVADRRLPDAQRLLQELLDQNPHNHYLRCALGHVAWALGQADAEQHYRDAIEGFAGRQQVDGHLLALESLSNWLVQRGRVDEAEEVLRQARELIPEQPDANSEPSAAQGEGKESEKERSGSSAESARTAPGVSWDLLRARVDLLEAIHLARGGGDLERARTLLLRAEPVLAREGQAIQQRRALHSLAVVQRGLGRSMEAESAYRRLAEVAQSLEDIYDTAVAEHGLALVLLDRLERRPRPEGRAELVRRLRRSLAASRRAGNRQVELHALRLLEDFTGGSEQHYQRCLELAANLGEPAAQAACLRSRARRLAASQDGPGGAVDALAIAEARRLLDEALELGQASGLAAEEGRVWYERLLLALEHDEPERAWEVSLDALAAIETLRSGQRLESSRAGLFSLWLDPYYVVAGSLLRRVEAGTESSDTALEQAFFISERIRARVLLEVLAHSSQAGRQGPSQEADQAALQAEEERIKRSSLQRRLLDPRLSEEQQADLLQQLQVLEQTARLRGSLPRGDAVLPATLAKVRAALGPDQALLSFLLHPQRDLLGRRAGGAWLLVLSRDFAGVLALPEPAQLEPRVDLLRGLLERRDGRALPALNALYSELLAPALARLPNTVRRLVLIPDGALHGLPFSALGEAGEAPLGERFQISRAPSASFWLRNKEQERGALLGEQVLVLADPAHPAARGSATTRPVENSAERSATLLNQALPGRLPHAQREAKAVRSILGSRTRILSGAAASESTLLASDLSQLAVLHLAAHALVDDQDPERSAVLLAPGNRAEDGLLQSHEVRNLALDGRLVVLSACRSAAGAVWAGEGVQSLAREFFRAGAATVVGSLWPLRDDEAADFFAAFYRHLAVGAEVAEALALARGERRQAGAPVAAWAGLEALGQGDLVPIGSRLASDGSEKGRAKPGNSWTAPRMALVTTGLLAALLTVFLGWRRRKHRASSGPP